MQQLVRTDAQTLLGSSLCRERDFSTHWYTTWVRRIAEGAPPLDDHQKAVWGPVWEGMHGRWMHRKLWEWCAISQALDERGMLRNGRHGIGFAVGQEPLSSLFAATGASVLATDLVSQDSHWSTTRQMASSKRAIHWDGLLPWPDFEQRVQFASIDMCSLSSLPRSAFDFAWSSCSLEHLGNLDLGIKFVLDSMELLRPGGVAVHTTEFNISSDDETVETGDSVIYRRRDIENLDRVLRLKACGIEKLDFDPGSEPADLDFDRPPYYTTGSPHLKLQLFGHVSTSLMLIIRKAR
jgi:SAM-dependent methyltransferase